MPVFLAIMQASVQLGNVCEKLAQDPAHSRCQKFLSFHLLPGQEACFNRACHCHINNNDSHALNDYYEMGTVSGNGDN